jgi:hypothetical protein
MQQITGETPIRLNVQQFVMGTRRIQVKTDTGDYELSRRMSTSLARSIMQLKDPLPSGPIEFGIRGGTPYMDVSDNDSSAFGNSVILKKTTKAAQLYPAAAKQFADELSGVLFTPAQLQLDPSMIARPLS